MDEFVILLLKQSKHVLKGLDRLTKQQMEYKLILSFRGIRVNFEVVPAKSAVVKSMNEEIGQPESKSQLYWY